MLWLASELKDFTPDATDGSIGSVMDVLFDDRDWTVRWLAIDTGNWLPGRAVLIPSSALGKPAYAESRIPISLTKQQVEDSPGLERDAPFSRQMEADQYRYWGGTPYWTSGVPYPGVGPAGLHPLPVATGVPERRMAKRAGTEGDPDLRSADEVTGYSIRANDGDIGHVEDIVIDDDGWAVRYVVVDTVNWWPGKKVVVAPEWIKDVSWSERKVGVALDRATIKAAPEWDPVKTPGREYEERLYRHYGYAGYWLDPATRL
ncbi:MAG: PRC-barrel domain-containing protein [Hyphomicrobiaceae bacterium]